MFDTVPIVSVVGATATGKSAFVYGLAADWQQAGYVAPLLISVDSRQVYQGMEILTGVDLPDPAVGQLVGVSLITPDQPWSVGHFCRLVRPLLVQAAREQRPVLLVGGTGLYHQQLFSSDVALVTPPNPRLRMELAEAEVGDIQRLVQTKAPTRWAEMNQSDRANPRRLQRALELVQSAEVAEPLPPLPPYRLFTVGLRSESARLAERIAARVRQRFEQGAIPEVEALIARYPDWSHPAFSSTGVREVRAYLEGQLSAEQCLERWTQREVAYAKRQATWWKKQAPDFWADVSEQTTLRARLARYPTEPFAL